jgi:hypothetical protein
VAVVTGVSLVLPLEDRRGDPLTDALGVPVRVPVTLTERRADPDRGALAEAVPTPVAVLL